MWAGFENDGDLDWFATGRNRNHLYRNEGGGNFKRVTNSIVTTDGQSAGCIWLDFDNDGWLDLVTPGPKNLLYHNSGDGTFLKVTTGAIVGQAIPSWGNNSFASADANRDGFADLLWVDWDGNSQFFQNLFFVFGAACLGKLASHFRRDGRVGIEHLVQWFRARGRPTAVFAGRQPQLLTKHGTEIIRPPKTRASGHVFQRQGCGGEKTLGRLEANARNLSVNGAPHHRAKALLQIPPRGADLGHHVVHVQVACGLSEDDAERLADMPVADCCGIC